MYLLFNTWFRWAAASLTLNGILIGHSCPRVGSTAGRVKISDCDFSTMRFMLIYARCNGFDIFRHFTVRSWLHKRRDATSRLCSSEIVISLKLKIQSKWPAQTISKTVQRLQVTFVEKFIGSGRVGSSHRTVDNSGERFGRFCGAHQYVQRTDHVTSVTLRYCITTSKRRITQIMSHDSQGNLVF